MRALFGPDPSSAAWVILVVAAQFALAIWVAGQSLAVFLALSFTVGPVLAHALGVLIHEASHNLVLRGSGKNKALAILANLPHGAPAAMGFRHQHLLHHRYLGETSEPRGRDTQAPTRKEVAFVRHSALRKFLSFTFGRFFYRARPANTSPRDVWLVANFAACIVVDVALVGTRGFGSLAYLLLSSMVAFGPHALGGRRVAEHLTIRRGQPTNSYYGLWNRVSFDVGYHVEHHDFPGVPWRRLRRLHAMAREHYEGLASVASWSYLMVEYFLDPRFSVGQYTGVSSDFVEEWAPGVAPKSARARSRT